MQEEAGVSLMNLWRGGSHGGELLRGGSLEGGGFLATGTLAARREVTHTN